MILPLETFKPEGLFEHARNKKNNGKPVQPLKGIRNSRLDEITGGFVKKTIKADPTRTLQPMKGFDLEEVKRQVEREEEEAKRLENPKKESIELFKMHRAFSEVEDMMHREMSDLD